jgi:hypothetical protein
MATRLYLAAYEGTHTGSFYDQDIRALLAGRFVALISGDLAIVRINRRKPLRGLGRGQRAHWPLGADQVDTEAPCTGRVPILKAETGLRPGPPVSR